MTGVHVVIGVYGSCDKGPLILIVYTSVVIEVYVSDSEN